MYRSQKVIIFLLIVFLCLGAAAIYELWRYACLHSLSAFISVMIFGFGVIIYRLLRGSPTPVVKYTHVVIHIIATIVLIVGLYTAKLPTGTDGIHAKPGFVIIAALVLQFLVALFVFTYLYNYRRLRLYFAPFHDIFGIWLFICLIGVSVAGVYSEFVHDDVDDSHHRFRFLIFAYLTGIIIIVIVLSPYFEWELVNYK